MVCHVHACPKDSSKGKHAGKGLGSNIYIYVSVFVITYALCFPTFLWASFWTWGLAKGKGKAIAMALLAKGKAKGKGKGETQEEPPRNEKEPVEKDPRAEKKMEQLRRMCRQSVKADNPENKHVSENACEKPLKKKRSRKNLEVPSETPVEPTSTRKRSRTPLHQRRPPQLRRRRRKNKRNKNSRKLKRLK